ncbi:uncharacterized protein LOC133295188 [Gastrolobium bilobum]|uniref:uncharacterized protein LOC133295188 n=1 Tax=Gastrolobium bilobum TaxID=150636 RepID=UPI002AB09D3B|nr:uncharacterized protein LOC133295188 [Gastrolobium bilobum]
MGRHVLLALMLLSLIVFDSSDASFVWELRKLVALDPKDNKTQTTQDSPPPKDSPPPSEKKPDPNPVGETIKNKENTPSTNNDTVSPVPPQPLTKVENGTDHQKEPNNTDPRTSAPPVTKKDDGGKNQEEEKKKNGLIVSQSNTNETCDGLNKCTDDGDMLACISKFDPKYLVVLLQNRGDGTIKVKLRNEFESNLGDVEVGKNNTEKVNITQTSRESTQLTLNAGKGDCVLHTVTRIPEANFFLRLPSYDKILTPVNGAYFLIVTVVVFGGTWACCMFRKKRHDEVPYQELEMGLPESVSATNVESAEGWDQGWDDDWDDNVAVKSPSVHAGSISANGLTSRSSNKDGWENNWDD